MCWILKHFRYAIEKVMVPKDMYICAQCSYMYKQSLLLCIHHWCHYSLSQWLPVCFPGPADKFVFKVFPKFSIRPHCSRELSVIKLQFRLHVRFVSVIVATDNHYFVLCEHKGEHTHACIEKKHDYLMYNLSVPEWCQRVLWVLCHKSDSLAFQHGPS